ncbi:hypothetical protein ACSQ67_015551 [Phaseolus vulgaris]
MSSSQNSCVLPQDMLMEILCRLSVKDLLRLKRVSKGWNHLISDSTFVKLHLQRSSKNTHILLTFHDYFYTKRRNFAIVCPVQDLLDNPNSTLETLSHKYRPFDRNYSILGVCNGLVCLGDYNCEFKEYWVRFGNPATRIMSKNSPHVRLNPDHYNYPYMFMIGFGYDDWSDTYQVVFLDNNRKNSQKLDVRVYCSGDKCWRKTFTCDAVPTLTGLGTCVSGTLNWLVFPKSCSDGKQLGSVKMSELEIFSYHLKKETCSYFSVPDGTSEVLPFLPALVTLKGCLGLSHINGHYLVVWLKREFSDEKSWSKLLNLYNPICDDLEILYMCENDNVVVLANTNKGEFILYNIREKRIDGRQKYNKFKMNLFSYDYVQSLVLPYRN